MSRDFDTFFADTWRGMVAKAFRLCGNLHDAEDAVQEAYAEALRAWPRIAGFESPEAWVHNLIRQRLTKTGKRRARLSPTELGTDLALPLHAGPEQIVEAREVRAALDSLPGRMRFVMVSICVDGMTQAEIARELGLSRSAISAQVKAARIVLEQRLGLAPGGRRAGHELVSAATPGPVGWPTAAAPEVDRLAEAIRASELLIAEALACDPGAARRMRAAIAAAAAGGRARPPRWALRRSRPARRASGVRNGVRGAGSR